MSEEDLRKRLVTENTQARQLGFLGEARVNVLSLNLSLDGMKSEKAQGNQPPGRRKPPTTTKPRKSPDCQPLRSFTNPPEARFPSVGFDLTLTD